MGPPPTDSSVRLGVSPTTTTPTDFYSKRFWGFSFPHWNPELYGLSHSLVVPPGLFPSECGTSRSASCCHTCPVCQPLPCHASSPPWLPISAPPTSLDQCFFFNSLVVGLQYSLIFWQFWLFFIFKFIVILVLVEWESETHLPTPPSWLEPVSPNSNNSLVIETKTLVKFYFSFFLMPKSL